LIEAKCSRSDLLADRKKPFRVEPEKGMGDWRFMISEPGIVNIAKADCISLLTVWRPCSEPVMKGHLETVVLQKAAGYLAKFIV
ncbi:hypothetical protein JWE21_29185, partial [Klebsiella pneumoniae]|nr:hypothetical protein [Klebsiella pneumoniae]